jgi:hypothetical protein
MKRKTLLMFMTVLVIVAFSTGPSLYAVICGWCEGTGLCDVSHPCDILGPEKQTEYVALGAYDEQCDADPQGNPNCDDWEGPLDCREIYFCENWCGKKTLLETEPNHACGTD